MNGRRKRILTSLGSLSFATLLAGIAFKRQLDNAKPEGESKRLRLPSSGNLTRIYKRKCKEPVKNGTALLKNGTAPHHLALQGASPLRGSLDARQGFTFLPKKIL